MALATRRAPSSTVSRVPASPVLGTESPPLIVDTPSTAPAVAVVVVPPVAGVVGVPAEVVVVVVVTGRTMHWPPMDTPVHGVGVGAGVGTGVTT
ncbi:MAG: hypothetical protein JWM18_2038, partial [Chloroflexi bacterium]|nr:hypothetical protein [Chloroflexota bacterium]